MFPCSVTKVDRLGTSRISEYYDLRRYVLTKSPTNDCPACASPHTDIEPPVTWSGCVVYSNEIKITVTQIPSAQIHPSLNSSHSLEESIQPRRQGTYKFSSLATTTDSVLLSTCMTVNLVLPQRSLEKTHLVLTATSKSNICSKVHTPHPEMSIIMKQLHTLQGLIKLVEHQLLPNQIILHRLRLTAVSPLIPRDRSLHLTMDNVIY